MTKLYSIPEGEFLKYIKSWKKRPPCVILLIEAILNKKFVDKIKKFQMAEN